MANISKITLPNGSTYDVKDATARTQISSEAATRKAADDSINNIINSLKSSLTGAMHYVGETSTALTDGSETSPIKIIIRPGTTLDNTDYTSNSGTAQDITDYTPKSGDVVIYQDKEFVYSKYANGGVWNEFGSTGSFKALAFKDSASCSYTPAGSVSQPTFTGNQGSVSVSGVVNATVSIHMGSVDNGTGTSSRIGGFTHQNEFTPSAKATGADVALNTAMIRNITGVGTLPALTTTVSGETLNLSWSAGSLPTAATVSVATSVKSVTQPTVTVGKIFYDYNDVTGNVASTGTFTPSGSVSKPSFAGTAATIKVK